MKRQSLFKYSAVSTFFLFITMYSCFWYVVGLKGFDSALIEMGAGVVSTFVLFGVSLHTSTRRSFTRKHSIVFSMITFVPVLILLMSLILFEGEVSGTGTGFAYVSFLFLTLCHFLYVGSIFVKE